MQEGILKSLELIQWQSDCGAWNRGRVMIASPLKYLVRHTNRRDEDGEAALEWVPQDKCQVMPEEHPE